MPGTCKNGTERRKQRICEATPSSGLLAPGLAEPNRTFKHIQKVLMQGAEEKRQVHRQQAPGETCSHCSISRAGARTATTIALELVADPAQISHFQKVGALAFHETDCKPISCTGSALIKPKRCLIALATDDSEGLIVGDNRCPWAGICSCRAVCCGIGRIASGRIS